MTDGIQHVSDTARWVALYRAMESDRRDALFRDPYARRLAGERAERILAGMKRGREWAWPMIVRTAVMDELILRAIDRDGVTTVLNLAAGLDARPYRLPLPARRGAPGVHARAGGGRSHRRRAAPGAVRPDQQRGTPGAGRNRGPADLPDARAGSRARRRSRRPAVVPLVAVGHRVAAAAQDAGKDVGPRGGGGQRPVPVRARRGHGVLRAARVARSGVPLETGKDGGRRGTGRRCAFPVFPRPPPSCF